MGRKPKASSERLIYKQVGMKTEHWTEIKKSAEKRGWSVNRLIRNVSVNFARGKLINSNEGE